MAAVGHFEYPIRASSPEPTDQLTRNLVGSIEETCKYAKIVKIKKRGWPAAILKI